MTRDVGEMLVIRVLFCHFLNIHCVRSCSTRCREVSIEASHGIRVYYLPYSVEGCVCIDRWEINQVRLTSFLTLTYRAVAQNPTDIPGQVYTL